MAIQVVGADTTTGELPAVVEARIVEIAGGGGGTLTPDPDEDGLFIIQSGSTQLTEDPAEPGLFIISA